MQARSEVVPVEACRYGPHNTVLLRCGHTLARKTLGAVAFPTLFAFCVFLKGEIIIN